MIAKILCLFVASIALASAEVEDRIAQIRKWYAAIDDGKPVSEKTLKFEQEGDPFSGTVSIRHFPDGLAAVTVDYVAGDHGGGTDHYYFRNGDVFFIYLVGQSWRFAEGGTPDKPVTEDTRREDRYYYDEEGKCVRHLSRAATSKDPDALPTILSQKKQEDVPPDVEAEFHAGRAKPLLNAATAQEVLEIYLEQGC
ncbi:hypothetical protein [Haloferula sargassicola]|uniref:Uncharacterized protein n=1 Tax=Haloferula sargassicola TaxID=490096 RepID=A0ABP9UV59_9BACT